MNLLQRTLATLSATGTAALMALPVLAQSAPMTSECSAYMNGGIGGPVDTQSSSNSSNQTSSSGASNQTAPSSYDTASSGVQGNTSVPLGNSAVPPSPSSMNQSSNSTNMGQSMNGETIGSTEYNTILQAAGSPQHRQFDGNNRSAAVPFRNNAPAATSGHEAKLNLEAYQEGQNLIASRNLNETAIRTASNPIPVSCLPR
jgi:hypothetical protein